MNILILRVVASSIYGSMVSPSCHGLSNIVVMVCQIMNVQILRGVTPLIYGSMTS